MGRPSKFTTENKQRILEAKRVGASDRTAARVAGLDPATLRDWLKRGKDGPKDSGFTKFYEEYEQAAAHPRERALGIIYNALPDRPDLAWKYVERREEGYEAPVAAPAAIAGGPVNIMLSFVEASRPVLSEVIDVGSADPAPSEPTALPAPATRKPARRRKKP